MSFKWLPENNYGSQKNKPVWSEWYNLGGGPEVPDPQERAQGAKPILASSPSSKTVEKWQLLCGGPPEGQSTLLYTVKPDIIYSYFFD